MVRPDSFKITPRSEATDVTLGVQGELDMHTAEQLADAVAGALKADAERVTVDLQQLAFMDSTGLRQLIELHDRSRREGWTLTLVCPRQEAAMLVLRATGADTALPFIQAADQ